MNKPEWMQGLRQKAAEAMLGPWSHSQRINAVSGTEAAVWGSDGDCVSIVYGNLAYEVTAEENSAYIAAASPDRILELLSLLDFQQSKLEEMEKRAMRAEGIVKLIEVIHPDIVRDASHLIDLATAPTVADSKRGEE